jgi:GNAT superfamily N-acetyltransferase
VGDEAHLKELDVHPDAVGRGLGSALLAAVCETARARGEPSLSLTTFRDVPFNAPFYARRGFRMLRPGETGPALQALLAVEAEAGLPAGPRCAMRLDLRC